MNGSIPIRFFGMYTRGISISIWLIMLCSCHGSTHSSNDNNDTAFGIKAYPTDSNVPVDTDNHNVGNISTVTLDSSVGPPKDLDTTKLIEPVH